ncbi:hypothetical protein Ancab_020496 [Ancistrocladus abbreviatus]
MYAKQRKGWIEGQLGAAAPASYCSPPPISWYLRGITARTTEMLVSDLITEAARIKGVSDGMSWNAEHGFHRENYNEARMEDVYDIKERWDLHRRNGRQFLIKSLKKIAYCEHHSALGS